MRKIFYLLPVFAALVSCQPKKKMLVDDKLPWSVRMARSEMLRNPDPSHLDFVASKKWNYTNGLVCEAILDVYDKTGDELYFAYAKSYQDSMITADGAILTYKLSNYNIDHINPGKALLRVWDKAPEERYRIALDTLRAQLYSHPRTPEGGFWHKKVYPQQMWLDGIYMGDVFYAQWVSRYGADSLWQDIIHQYTLIAEKTYDPATGLYRHAWDSSREQRWADPETGQSPHAWGRAMGWYLMAIVDALDVIPAGEPGREKMVEVLNGAAESLVKIQDEATGGWYQVLDRSGDEGNYVETTCTSMFAYAFLKGIRQGNLDAKYLDAAKKAYNGLIDNFIVVDGNGMVTITKCCSVAGLGGNPYRDGSYEYYINEPVRDNDPKGTGPFIKASLEMEMLK